MALHEEKIYLLEDKVESANKEIEKTFESLKKN
jgi:hypothetical protein